MQTSSPVREVYVRDCPLDIAINWAASQMSKVRVWREDAVALTYCDGLRNGVETRVILTPGMEDGYLSISVRSPPFAWPTHVAMARAVFADLMREVRCDPGALGRAPLSALEWWSIGPDGEGLIDWPAQPHQD